MARGAASHTLLPWDAGQLSLLSINALPKPFLMSLQKSDVMWCPQVYCDAQMLAGLTHSSCALSGLTDTSVYSFTPNCSIGVDDACAGLTEQIFICCMRPHNVYHGPDNDPFFILQADRDMLRVLFDALSDAGHTQFVPPIQSTWHHPALAMLQPQLTTTVTHLRLSNPGVPLNASADLIML